MVQGWLGTIAVTTGAKSENTAATALMGRSVIADIRNVFAVVWKTCVDFLPKSHSIS